MGLTQRIKETKADQAAFCPSPEEIRQACRMIQSNWSASERARRMGLLAKHAHGSASEQSDLPSTVDQFDA